MSDRDCPHCGKEFPRPWELKRHLARKTPCAPILEREDLAPEVLEDPNLERKKCRFCGRVFSSYDSMCRHVRNTCRIAPNKRNGNTGMDYLYDYTLRKQQRENADLRARLTDLSHNMASLTQTMQQLAIIPSGESAQLAPAFAGKAAIAGETAIVGDGTVVLQDRRIVINVFGNESVSHVTPQQIREVLEESLRLPALPEAATHAVIKAALLIYSDPNHPENLTCYIPNKREGSALVQVSRDGQKEWDIRPVQIVAPPMAQKSVDLLFDLQPFDDAKMFEPLMRELRDNEHRYASGTEMRTILVRNKELLNRILSQLPVAGQTDGRLREMA